MRSVMSRFLQAAVACLTLVFLSLGSNNALAQSLPSSSCDEEVQEGCGESVANVTGETAATTAQQQATIIRGQVGNAVRTRLLDLRSRQAFNQRHWIAGTDGNPIFGDIGAWGNYAYRYIDMAPTDQTTRTDLHSGTLGIDTSLWGKLIVGLSLGTGRGHSDVSSSLPNNASTRSEIDQDTNTISPYLGYVINENFYLNAALGYSDEHVTNEIRAQSTNTLISRFLQDGDTRFAFVDVNYVRDWENWSFSATTGILRSITDLGDTRDQVNNALAFAAQRSDSTLWNIGAQATYNFKEMLFPYAAIAFEKSLVDRKVGLAEGQAGLSGTDLQTDDRDNLRLTIGLDWIPETMKSVVLSIEGDTVLGRSDYADFGALLNLRGTF